jgi:molybdate transport system substrate-binding protein
MVERLVIGQSALQAAQFVLSRNADAALLPYSLVLSKGFAGGETAVLVSETLYTPLSHEMILIRGTGDDARKFFRFLQSETVMDCFASNGL